MAKAANHSSIRIAEASKTFSDWARFRGSSRTLFGDMVHAWVLSLRNVFNPKDEEWRAREAEFAAWKDRVGPEGVEVAEKCLALLMLAFAEAPGDHLGEMFQGIQANSKELGQFFTPYTVSSSMATIAMSRESIRDVISAKGVVEAMEPSCGAGGMVVAMGQAMTDAGFDPSRHLRVTAIDIDMTAIDMTFVQSSLSGIPCFVRRADALDPASVSGYEFPNIHWAIMGASHPDEGERPTVDPGAS